jgi:hypothetical protein
VPPLASSLRGDEISIRKPVLFISKNNKKTLQAAVHRLLTSMPWFLVVGSLIVRHCHLEFAGK